MLSLALLCLIHAAPTVRLTASVDDGPARPGWVYAKAGQQVVLRAVAAGGKPVGYRWFKLEPTSPWVDNTIPSFHFAPIGYQAVELEACRDQGRCPADVGPTLLPRLAQLPGVGTMAFQVRATFEGGAEAATPGVEAVKYGGLEPTVMRVTYRKDDSYLGYCTELVNSPYIFGSAGPDGRNQSDLLIGSDCADLAIYGRRRLGKPASYASSYTIDQQAPERFRGVGAADGGVALDEAGQPIAFGAAGAQPGDLIHFPATRHVGVLYEDRPPLGALDASDLMLHTCWAPPTIEPISESRCASYPWRVLRFK
jgi:hypothetical protein